VRDPVLEDHLHEGLAVEGTAQRRPLLAPLLVDSQLLVGHLPVGRGERPVVEALLEGVSVFELQDRSSTSTTGFPIAVTRPGGGVSAGDAYSAGAGPLHSLIEARMPRFLLAVAALSAVAASAPAPAKRLRRAGDRCIARYAMYVGGAPAR